MSPCVLLSLLALLAQAPAVEVDGLKGDRHAGQLIELNSASLKLQQTDTTVEFPLAGVLEVRFPAPTPPEPSAGPRVALVDGTRLNLKDFRATGDLATLESLCCGTLTVPINQLAHVRFGISTTKLDEAWGALLARDSKGDLLVTRKEDTLDFLPGVAGAIGDKVAFLLDGEEIPVPREKVYGVVFRRRAAGQPKPLCEAALAGGDLLQCAQVRIDSAGCRATLVSGAELTLPAASLASLNFSAGKVRYLSQLEPREVKYIPWFDLVWEYRRDRTLDGNALSLGGKTYARGLAIHSKTTLRYRIAGEFSRLQALAGIDDDVRHVGSQVQLIISGDGKRLFDAPVQAADPPRPLDLDVTGVRDLEIVVDFGADGGLQGDRLDLADAKLIK